MLKLILTRSHVNSWYLAGIVSRSVYNKILCINIVWHFYKTKLRFYILWKDLFYIRFSIEKRRGKETIFFKYSQCFYVHNLSDGDLLDSALFIYRRRKSSRLWYDVDGSLKVDNRALVHSGNQIPGTELHPTLVAIRPRTNTMIQGCHCNCSIDCLSLGHVQWNW